MARTDKSSFQLMISLVIIVGLIGCGETPQQTTTENIAANIDSNSATNDALLALQNMRPRDVSGMDVCAVLPAETVAAAVDMTVSEVIVDLDTISCTYMLRDDAPYEHQILVSLLGNMGSFAIGRQNASDVEDVPNIGVDAYGREIVDGSYYLNAVRDDALYINVNAAESEDAVVVARLVVDTIPRE